MGQISHGVLTIGCLLGICDAPNDGSSWVLVYTNPVKDEDSSRLKLHDVYDDQGWHYRQFNHKVSASWSFHSCTTLAGPDKAARQSFRGKILNARASWVVNIINFPLSSPNNSIWKIIPNNPAQNFLLMWPHQNINSTLHSLLTIRPHNSVNTT